MFTRSYYSFWLLFWNRPIKLSQYKKFYEWLLQCNATRRNFNPAKLNFLLKIVKV